MAQALIQWTQDALWQLDAILDRITVQGGNAALVGKHIYAAVSRLTLFPESAPLYAATLRRLAILRLPISCYYLYHDGVVSILYVRHDYQLPLTTK